ncbi:MAG TPA: tetratricopeptide repeat protein [Verrucomicrobiae bacterium]|nr:tetratricopeptide repeat protein [Verrucomicrobiae bacterium]
MQSDSGDGKRSVGGGRASDPSFFARLIGVGLLLIGAVLILSRRHLNEAPVTARTPRPVSIPRSSRSAASASGDNHRRDRSGAEMVRSAEEIVASKLSQFGRSRREIVEAIGRREKKDVPPEIQDFFDAVEAGDWPRIDAAFGAMAKRSAQYEGSTHSPELDPFWPAVLETYGATEQAHDWPAQKLLDYGEAILGSLRPGMVYVGGTDPGRFIPTLLNETTDGEQHIVLTQNALADSRYMEYVRFQYGDRFGIPTEEDSKRVFQEYTEDAQKRLEHDQQFPNDPKQIQPGEKVEMVDGKVQVSGQIAVMAINEKLLQSILQKNPDASFAVEESFPMKTTYAGAVPLGPIMEIRAQDATAGLDEGHAAESLDYWRNTTQEILADPEALSSPDALKTYSKMAVAEGNLLGNSSYPAQAEEAYRLATEIFPRNTEAVSGLAQLLAKSGRMDEARQLINGFIQQNPDLEQQFDLSRKDRFWNVRISAGK